jgi:pimeloyl-ACP methyl ester carboxylesterase
MATVESNGLTIDYNLYGLGDINLLFVHGSYINQTYWQEQVQYFADNYKVITMDLAGHGRSGTARENWSVEGLADDVINLIKQLGLKNIILIGHSLGSNVNLIAASKYPEPIIGFVVIDNFKNVATPLPAEYEDQVDAILDNLKKDFAGTNEYYANMVLVTESTPPWITARVVDAYRNAYEPMGQATMPEVFELYKTEQELLPKLHLKSYLIQANYMPTNLEALEENAVHGFKVIEIPGTSHFPMLENPTALNKALDEVINEILGDRMDLD